ncbi:PDZ and LIM domain protein 1 isoform X7 [Pezoporus flaviventris]|uniref:PDZ and LIM domain protein 1 isoform X7 n=1 Tax=Pezoporus flaviventris TaxID=889875 RepID=UPI002AAFC9AA|nr:PDZ and LIM domain protein 1 isoform X7 [Pezoporus flaviventris]
MEWNGARRGVRRSELPTTEILALPPRLGPANLSREGFALERGGPAVTGAQCPAAAQPAWRRRSPGVPGRSWGGPGAGRAGQCRCRRRGCWASCEVQSRTWGHTASCCRAPGPGASAWWAAGTSSSPSPSPGTESKVWSPLVNEEGKTHPYKMNLASQPQEVRQIGSAHNRSAVPFTAATASAPRVITAQYNSPAGLYSSENIQTFNTAVESKTSPGALESTKPLDQHNQPPGSIVIDRESEVYKMLQENQESNEPPRQSASFLVLQEILESEEKGDPTKPSGFRSVKAPTTKVASSIGNAQKLPMCEKCGSGIVGVFVKIRDKQRHPECYVCSDCGTNLKQKGHFFVEDQIYCEKHARERVIPPEGYEVVTVFPK